MGSIGILSSLWGGPSIFLSYVSREEGRDVRSRRKTTACTDWRDPDTHISLLILGIVVVFIIIHLVFHEEALHRKERLVQTCGGGVSSENGGVVDP
jgi:hypothetical protein